MKTPPGTVSFSIPTSKQFIDLTGRMFGRMTVSRFSHSIQRSGGNGFRAYWVARCECGSEAVVIGHALTCGHTTSCGCKRRQTTKARLTTHGESRGQNSTEYSIWNSMLARCLKPNSPAFKYYGGRGITVCDRWINSFHNFFKDMGKRPSAMHSIDRIDNDLGYCKENCRWASKVEQARNTRSNRMLTYSGKTLCIAEWAEEAGLMSATIWQRLNAGWTVKEALETPNRRNSSMKH